MISLIDFNLKLASSGRARRKSFFSISHFIVFWNDFVESKIRIYIMTPVYFIFTMPLAGHKRNYDGDFGFDLPSQGKPYVFNPIIMLFMIFVHSL